MSLIPKAQAGILEESIGLVIDGKTIRMTKRISDSTIVMYFGGHEMYCVEAQIFTKTETTPFFIDVSVGNLVQVYYNQHCSLEQNFKRGIDTVRIIKLALSYIHDNYPYVKAMKFTDASTRMCANDGVVNLSEMGYVTSGKTWYETHFKAYLSPKHAQLYATETESFQKKKQAMSWNYVYPHITSPDPFPIEPSELKRLYETATTWQEFFTAIRSEIGVSEYCSFLSAWLHKFLEKFTTIRFLMLDFMIPIDKDLFVEYSHTPYVRGGKRFTRRKRSVNTRNALV